MKILCIAYLLNIVDYLFTAHWVRLYGIDIESNPVGYWMFENNIPWLLTVFTMQKSATVLSSRDVA